MKIQVLSSDGKKKGEITTEIFSGKVRQDIIQKVVEAEKSKHPYAPFYLAGKQASASGKTRHRRRKWKSAAGRGIARIPRKIFWRRGTQFHWEGATVSSARGGRRAHPPKILHIIKESKINKKEKQMAFLGALALTASIEDVKKKYKSLENKEIKTKLPIIVEGEILNLKTKDILDSLKRILSDLKDVAVQKRAVRAGKGKMRGRKYKKTSGLLFVTSSKEEKKIKGVEVKKAGELDVSDLASNGARLTLYTEESVKELGSKLGQEIKERRLEKKIKKVKKTKRKNKKIKRKKQKKKKPEEKKKTGKGKKK